MNRIARRFSKLRQQGRKAVVPYITAGDPSPDQTLPLMHAMVEAGADVIELGVPFSDPMADGPVIQAACERALAHHVSLRQVLEMVRRFRQDDNDTPVVLMGYLNPVEIMGFEAFAEAAAEAGVDGALTVDMPPEEGDELLQALNSHGIAPIFLLAPNTEGVRMERICRAARGFVYYVSLKGVTGAATLDVESVARKMEQIRQCTDLPIGVGFGIRDAQSAARIGAVADAVVVGSAIVRLIEANKDNPAEMRAKVAGLVGELRRGVDGTL